MSQESVKSFEFMWYKDTDVNTLRAVGEFAAFLIVKFFLGGVPPPAPGPPTAPLIIMRERRV